MDTDTILTLLNRAATVRLIAHFRTIVEGCEISISDADILQGIVYVY